MALSSGTKLGPYEIISPLGAGGMGEVYRSRDARLDRTVAIKVLPESLASNAEHVQRFEQEARSLSTLSHPNLLAIYDVGAQNGVHNKFGVPTLERFRSPSARLYACGDC